MDKYATVQHRRQRAHNRRPKRRTRPQRRPTDHTRGWQVSVAQADPPQNAPGLDGPGVWQQTMRRNRPVRCRFALAEAIRTVALDPRPHECGLDHRMAMQRAVRHEQGAPPSANAIVRAPRRHARHRRAVRRHSSGRHRRRRRVEAIVSAVAGHDRVRSDEKARRGARGRPSGVSRRSAAQLTLGGSPRDRICMVAVTSTTLAAAASERTGVIGTRGKRWGARLQVHRGARCSHLRGSLGLPWHEPGASRELVENAVKLGVFERGAGAQDWVVGPAGGEAGVDDPSVRLDPGAAEVVLERGASDTGVSSGRVTISTRV